MQRDLWEEPALADILCWLINLFGSRMTDQVIAVKSIMKSSTRRRKLECVDGYSCGEDVGIYVV